MWSSWYYPHSRRRDFTLPSSEFPSLQLPRLCPPAVLIPGDSGPVLSLPSQCHPSSFSVQSSVPYPSTTSSAYVLLTPSYHSTAPAFPWLLSDLGCFFLLLPLPPASHPLFSPRNGFHSLPAAAQDSSVPHPQLWRLTSASRAACFSPRQAQPGLPAQSRAQCWKALWELSCTPGASRRRHELRSARCG